MKYNIKSYHYQQLTYLPKATGVAIASGFAGSGLSIDEMQLIARQMNLSNALLLVKETNESAVKDCIFTPNMKCHLRTPTIGTAFVLHNLLNRNNMFYKHKRGS